MHSSLRNRNLERDPLDRPPPPPRWGACPKEACPPIYIHHQYPPLSVVPPLASEFDLSQPGSWCSPVFCVLAAPLSSLQAWSRSSLAPPAAGTIFFPNTPFHPFRPRRRRGGPTAACMNLVQYQRSVLQSVALLIEAQTLGLASRTSPPLLRDTQPLHKNPYCGEKSGLRGCGIP